MLQPGLGEVSLNLELHGKKLSMAIVLATLALSALFLAQGTTSLVAGALLPVSARPRR